MLPIWISGVTALECTNQCVGWLFSPVQRSLTIGCLLKVQGRRGQSWIWFGTLRGAADGGNCWAKMEWFSFFVWQSFKHVSLFIPILSLMTTIVGGWSSDRLVLGMVLKPHGSSIESPVATFHLRERSFIGSHSSLVQLQRSPISWHPSLICWKLLSLLHVKK